MMWTWVLGLIGMKLYLFNLKQPGFVSKAILASRKIALKLTLDSRGIRHIYHNSNCRNSNLSFYRVAQPKGTQTQDSTVKLPCWEKIKLCMSKQSWRVTYPHMCIPQQALLVVKLEGIKKIKIKGQDKRKLLLLKVTTYSVPFKPIILFRQSFFKALHKTQGI